MSEFKKMKLSEARAKFEQIDELDTSTLKSYRTKARAQGNAIVDKMKMGGGDWSKDQKDTKTLRKRAAGAQMSGKQLVKRGESLKTEEAEQIDELSKETLGRYAQKAKDQLGKAEYRAGVKMGNRHMGAKPDSMERAYNVRANKRHAGLTMAIDKLAKEEVEAVAEGTNKLIKAKDNGSYPAHHDHITHDTYGDAGEEATAAHHKFAASNSPVHTFKHEGSTHKIFHHPNGSTIHTMEHSHGHHGDDIAVYSGHHDPKHIESQEKKYGGMDESACMTDTSAGGADNITASKTGENYKKTTEKTTGPSPASGTATHVAAGKTGEAYNAVGVTKRVPAVESAVLDVMSKTLEKRKMFEDASNIAIISPEQRQDWLDVSTGNMNVVDYFNKYKV